MKKSIPDKETISKVAERIESYIHRTPVVECNCLNEIVSAKLYFKCENLQKAGSFKIRGATNAVFQLSNEECENGVATHSSGNHAQALALAAKRRDIKAYIVMPSNAPSVKVDAVRYYGGEITFCDPNLNSRESTLKDVVAKTGACIIHPYDDYRTIAGQATAAKELMEDTEGLDYILAPVGGGGLLSGTLLSTHYFSEKTKVIAVEPSGADDAYRSLKEGRIVPSVNPTTIADGLLTSLGERNFPIIQKYVEEIITVDDEYIKEAMDLIMSRMKLT
ncbi:MAG: pyridoxal-phosphate dependent enzyme, partial [Deltaproteobacteria bacterium]|nr:pyridoxal-phosphate dependent enzyme [Deltaproteobacteria bacterium]